MTTSPAHHASLPTTSRKVPPFRFKRKPSEDSTAFDLPSSKRRSHSASGSRHAHGHRHHHRRRHRSRRHNSPSPSTDHQLDPETAFRESLFDALADDEGAAFWESVYGQPIHTYSPYVHSAGEHGSGQAELQRMTDDEYATHVRTRMWEKSHAHVVGERRRREEQSSRRKEKEEQYRKWERDVEAALRRGEEKRRKTKWKEAWGRYLQGWEALSSPGHGRGKKLKDQIPWPVETGRYRDVDQEQVEIFFRHGPQSERPSEAFDLTRVLKIERVRWHPDKILQKARGDGLDEEIMAMVTAVFQIIDKLWSGMRPA
ncbi:MAG: hypothetical protein LQ339_001283 [Xanthoria mediterranea]|nr:MAG: hypothetical protein LQ339_001283 [Xanthoria mediterranea]